MPRSRLRHGVGRLSLAVSCRLLSALFRVGTHLISISSSTAASFRCPGKADCVLNPLGMGYKAREVRHSIFVPARMCAGSSWTSVVIHNISSRGALLASDEAPARGTYVEIRRGQQTIIGRVVWQEDRFFGVKSRETIHIQAIVDEPRLSSRPNSTEKREASRDRRASPRRQMKVDAARQLEDSQRWSAMFQFCVFVLLGILVAGFVASEVYDVISKPMAKVRSAL